MPCPNLPLKNKVEPLHVSKWLTCSVLLETQELQRLIAELPLFWIFSVGKLLGPEQGEISSSEFLEAYDAYMQSIKRGSLLPETAFQASFSTVWTCSLEALYAVYIDEEHKLIKPCRPVIQLQHHKMSYSKDDKKFRSMVFGVESIYWGLQFSYPQLYQDPQSLKVETVRESEAFPNTYLFHALQRWMRRHTIPTPFLVGEQIVNTPMRIGRECLPWIHHHPQLVQKDLRVVVKSERL